MSGQPAVIVDVDDTLCDVSEIRHLYAVPDDFRAFTVASRDCPPRREVLDWCHQFHADGHAVLVVTGRSDEFRDITGKTFEDESTELKERLGDRYWNTMKEILDSELHAVGHALLAGLRVHQMVTTNFDPCMETALGAITGDECRVMVRQLAEGGKPWLLKLHGDIRLPGSLVLDRVDFEQHMHENEALCGVVQGLLLTSHLLFVGFSFRDRDFLSLAKSVSLVRAAANRYPNNRCGTALALTKAEAESMPIQDLDTLAMLATDLDEAARLLEIFLDRLAWSAATNHELSTEYLLDDRYASGLSESDLSLRRLLTKMRLDADHHAKSSPGWLRVVDCLNDLGADRGK